MKTRNGFVSNSSSTSFTFVHKKKDLKGLCELILKWDQYFDLRWPYDPDYPPDRPMYVKADGVVDAIQGLKEGKEYGEVPRYTITQFIKVWKERAQHYQSRIDESHKEIKQLRAKEEAGTLDEKDSWRLGYEHDRLSEKIQDCLDAEHQVDYLNRLKSEGFKYVHEINFGDNHGQVQGVGVGDIMDYAGRDINMEKDDLVIWTEQNR